MTRLLGILVVLVLLVAGLGYYRGWFQAETSTSTNGQSTLSITVDKDKINQDKAKAKEEVHDLEQKK